MSAKRRALKQITRDNWEESDDEEATNESFISNKDEMKNRKILTAKRRSGSSAQNTPTHKPFDDLKIHKTNNFHKANGDSPQPIKQDILNYEEKEIIEFYYSCLEKLNSSICEWVDKCVKATPRGDLSPIFSNYFKHIKELKEKLNIECLTSKETTLSQKNQELEQPFWTSEIQNTKGPPYITPVNSQIDIGFFKQAVSSAIHNETSNKISSITSFANFNTLSQSHNFINDRNILSKEPATSLVSSALPNASKPFSFSFTSNQMSVPNATPTTNTFNFMAKVTPFKASLNSNGKATAEDSGDDGPATAPDPESNELSDYVPTALNLPPALDPNKPAWEEQGAFYVRKCKLFLKEGTHFAEQGLGFAYVKDLGGKSKGAPAPSKQLLIRADNASGTVLLNAAVPPNTPVTLSGKNGVLLVVPGTKGVNSDDSKADLKPVTYLVRVKTSEDAKELRDALLTNNLD